MTIEGRAKFLVARAVRIKGKVEDDQTRAGIAEPVDQFRIDRPGPGELLAHLLQRRRTLDLFRAYLIQLLGRFVDPQKNEFAMRLCPERSAFESVAETGLACPDTVHKDDPKGSGGNDHAGADRANQGEGHAPMTSEPVHAGF